jgi:hypothetical protein
VARLEFSYPLLSYEREFAAREVAALGGHVLGNTSGRTIRVDGLDSQMALWLTYSHRVAYPNAPKVSTVQGLREGLEPTRKQNTGYGPHGLHQYKGKFHPQTPRSLILQHEWESGLPILDPFAGTGTTLLEARGLGQTSEGVELNPLAALIAKAKLAWEVPPGSPPPSCAEFEGGDPEDLGLETTSYLQKWFPVATLGQICRCLGAFSRLEEQDSLVARTVLSNLLRSYSWQDPEDLRIRRRKTIPKQPRLLETLSAALVIEWDRRNRWIKAGLPTPGAGASLFCGDSRYLRRIRGAGPVAGSVTSPPYACALPYIDTYRLSLATLGLAAPNQITQMEYETIGGREVEKEDRDLFEARVSGLPPGARRLIAKIQDRLRRDQLAGFRRRAVPFALARYFTQMQDVMRELREIEPSGAPNLWVVGPNTTTLMGERIPIPTPALIGELASAAGFHSAPSQELEAFRRFGSHSKNAIREETLVRFYG